MNSENEKTDKYFSVREYLRTVEKLDVSKELLEQAIEGYLQGSKWVLKKYSRFTKPELRFGKIVGHEDFIGFLATEKGEQIVLFPIETLRDLINVKNSETQIQVTHHFSGFNNTESISFKQFFEDFGVEETTHFVAFNGHDDLSSIPQNLLYWEHKGDEVGYYLQPHEYEALLVRAEYFLDNYGINPFEKLINFLNREKSKRKK